MRYRPWPIVLLAICQLCMPLINIVTSAILMEISILQYLRDFFATQSTLQIIDFFGTYVVLAISIFAVKKWSPPVFLTATLWNIVQIFRNQAEFPTQMPMVFAIICVIMNVVLVGYFLIPQVWVLYLDARLRWWERLPRFQIRIPVNVQSNLKPMNSHITDLSVGGVFIESPTHFLPLDESVKVEFEFLSLKFLIEGRIAHYRPTSVAGYGIQFHELPKTDKAMLKRLTSAFKILGIHCNTPERRVFKDFKQWLSGLISREESFIPKIHKTGAKK